MGRGLSWEQKQILIYVRDHAEADGVAPWFDAKVGAGKFAIGEEIFPSGPDNPDRKQKVRYWSPEDIVTVSRALRRLELRGLVRRIPKAPPWRPVHAVRTPQGVITIPRHDERVRPRTGGVALTPEGIAAAGSLPA